MPRSVTVLVTQDEECSVAGQVFTTQVKADLAQLPQPVDAHCKVLTLANEPCAHREAIYSALQQLFHVKHNDLFIVCLLNNSAPDEYRRIHDFCTSTKPKIDNLQVLTSLKEFSDAGLLMRNLARKVVAAVAESS